MIRLPTTGLLSIRQPGVQFTEQKASVLERRQVLLALQNAIPEMSVRARQDFEPSEPSKVFGVLKRGFGASIGPNLGPLLQLVVEVSIVFMTTTVTTTVVAN